MNSYELDLDNPEVLVMRDDAIDWDNTVFVLSCPILVFITAIISKGHAINVIFESVEGNREDYLFDAMHKMASYSIEIKTSQDVILPRSCREYNRRPDETTIHYFERLKKIKADVNKILEKNKYDTYLGGGFLVQYLDKPKSYIKMHHGVSDDLAVYANRHYKNPYRRNLIMIVRGWIRKNILDLPAYIVYGKIIGLPTHPLSRKIPRKCYSLYDFVDEPDAKWVDYTSFESSHIEKALEELVSQVKEDSVLFLPHAYAHYSKDGYHHNPDTDTRKNDDSNLEMLRNAGINEKDRVFVKFHPSLYYGGKGEMKEDLILAIQKEFGCECFDIADFLPDEIGGILLPIELISKYCYFSKIICDVSSSLINMKYSNSEKYMAAKYGDKNTLKIFEAFIFAMRVNNQIDQRWHIGFEK